MTTSPPATTPSQQARRRAIVDAARRVFLRDGFEAATIDAIADEARVSKQTIYNYGWGKEYLFEQVVNEMTDHCGTMMVRAVESVPPDQEDVAEELLQIAVGICERFFDPEANAFRPMVEAESRRNATGAEGWERRGIGRTMQALADRFARMTEAGRLRVDDPMFAARQFYALTTWEADRISLRAVETYDAEFLARSQREGVRMFLRTYGP